MAIGKEVEHYLAEQRAFEGNGASGAPSWLKEMRSTAIDSFSRQGFPTIHDEDWRFTDILPLAKIPFTRYGKDRSPLNVARVGELVYRGSRNSVLVFVDGRFDPSLSDTSALPAGVVVRDLAAAILSQSELVRQNLNRNLPLQKHPFAALNSGFIDDGAFVHIPAKTHIEVPIELLFVSTAEVNRKNVSHPRNLILVDETASATLLESYVSVGEGTHFTNAVTEVRVASEAAVDYVKISGESGGAYHVGTMEVHQASKSRFTGFSLALGGSISRNDFNITVDGEQCETMLDGLYVSSGDQLIDHHTFIDHKRPECSSREIFKGIVAGRSRTVFNGKILVRQEAQKTDSKQTNKNLLLSEKATVDTKPQLEIFADDVKCTHGATVGGLDGTSLFYVKSRGVGEEAAQGVLTAGFASEVTGFINDESLREHVDGLVLRKLRDEVIKVPLPDIVHSMVKPG